MSRSREIFDKHAAHSSYNHTKEHLGGSISVVAGARTQQTPEQILRKAIAILGKPLEPSKSSQHSTAVLMCIKEPQVDRTKIALSHTDNRTEPHDAAAFRMARIRSQCHQHSLRLESVSESAPTCLTWRVKLIVLTLLSASTEKQHCQPEFRNDPNKQCPHNHDEFVDGDWATVSYILEHLMEAFEQPMYEVTEWYQGVRWHLNPEFARRWRSLQAKISEDRCKDPRDMTDLICETMRDEEWQGPCHEETPLTTREEKDVRAIISNHTGRTSVVLGVHELANVWWVTMPGKPKADGHALFTQDVRFDRRIHARTVLGPCLAAHVSTTNSPTKKRRYLKLWRHLRLRPVPAPSGATNGLL